ncbi:cyclin-like protein [Thozetella sp. PMI_491]|nr:cyclin-like protein [Thozetella sp. PMI_491]
MSYGGVREGYVPPSLPPKPSHLDRPSKSPVRRRDVPPAVPSPPSYSSRNSPPRPQSRRSAPSPAQSTPPRPSVERPNQWFFTADEVASTPSIIEGLSLQEERLRRAKGVNFIYQAGILLDLPMITLWVAGVFFHRLYMRLSMVEEKGGIHHYNIAATALFLANKTEENCRKTKDLIIAVARVAQKNAKLVIDEQSKEYWRWRDSILAYEELMLEMLTFDLVIENPYQQLYEHLGTLDLLHNRKLRDSAWAFCNDSCLTILPLMLGARDLAIAAIFFATSVTHEKIDDLSGGPWWKFLRANEAHIVKAVEMMAEFYKENPLRKQDSKYPQSPVFNLESTRRRGETIHSQTEAGSSNGTPIGTDRGTQSPRARGIDRDRGDRDEDDADIKRESQFDIGRGDSDAVLKAVANDLSLHEGRPNGKDIPVKRKTPDLDLDSDGERRAKRARTADEDEGEVIEP